MHYIRPLLFKLLLYLYVTLELLYVLLYHVIFEANKDYYITTTIYKDKFISTKKQRHNFYIEESKNQNR